jgi:hypothetical protein
VSRDDQHKDYAFLLGELAEVKNRLARIEREKAKEKASEAFRDDVENFLHEPETYSVSPDIRRA